MKIGDSFSKDIVFTAAGISSFARMTGDMNPLHHNIGYAIASRFGGVIASGSHVTALMMGMVAGHFADKGVNVGLDFSFRFLAPVRAGDTIAVRWTVTEVVPKASLKGDIITLEGEAVRPDGTVAVASGAHAVLFYPEE